MKICVKKILVEKEGIVVWCRTPIGDLKGMWTQKEEPVIGEEYHAELCIEEYSNKITVSVMHDYSVSINENLIDFIGLCEGADEEVLYIRLAIDWIEMIDLVDGIKIGDDFVRFSADYRKIKIYPYEL